MAKESKSAWKCDICSQTLSSKQVAKFHVELKHPEADQTKCNVVRVNITVTNKADNVLVITKEKIPATKWPYLGNPSTFFLH